MPDSTDRTGGTDPYVIRAGAGVVWLVLTAAVIVLLLGDVLIRGGVSQAALIAPWPLLLVWFVYVFVWAPRVVATNDGVAIHNVLRIVHVSWAAVDEIRSRWQLEFHLVPSLDRKPVQAWGAPVQRPNRFRRADASVTQIDRLAELRDAAPPADATVRTTWDIPAVAAGILLAAWAVASFVIAF